MYVSLYVFLFTMYMQYLWRPEEGVGHPGIVSPMWVLGLKLRSSGRTANALNQWPIPISPVTLFATVSLNDGVTWEYILSLYEALFVHENICFLVLNSMGFLLQSDSTGEHIFPDRLFLSCIGFTARVDCWCFFLQHLQFQLACSISCNWDVWYL